MLRPSPTESTTGLQVRSLRQSRCGMILARNRRAGARLVVEAAMMEKHYVWVTTRRLMPGTLQDFEQAWRPEQVQEIVSRSAEEPEANGR